MNEIICAICGKPVSKRKSYSLGNGQRACKCHEEAQKKKDELLAAKNRDEQAKEKALAEKRLRQKLDLELCGSLHCWCCHRKGTHAREFFARLAIEMEKHKIIRGEYANPFNGEIKEVIESARNRIEEDKRIPIYIISVEGKNLPPALVNSFLQSEREAMRFMGAISLCHNCADKSGLLPELPEIDLNRMMEIGAIVRPVIRKAAIKELGEEN